MRRTDEAIWCLWKHFKAFYEQCLNEKTADLAEACSDCELWNKCRGEWLDKIGKVKPDAIKISVGKKPK